MSAQFVIKQASNGQYLFNLKAANGEVIATSELYHAKASAENGIASVRKNATEDSNFLRRTGSNGQYYFSLRASNGEIIATSELYKTEEAREKGIASLKECAPVAEVVGSAEGPA